MKKLNDRKGKKKMPIIAAAIVLCIVTSILIILPPSAGKPKPFLDENGNVLEDSISEKTFVDINGTSLGMFVMAKNQSKPVLLMLGGGPGIPEYLLEHEYPTGLADEFVVCYLEYRGTSLSYKSGVDTSAMTLEQYVDDVIGVTDYLRDRFGQDKIYLMGHSFGTYIGINTVYQHPELYHSYIAMAQIADSRESEMLAYNYMLERYKADGNDNMVKQFEKYPIAASDEAFKEYSMSSLRDTAMHELGVGTTRAMRSVMSGIFFPSLRCGAYTQAERINIWRGKAFAQEAPVALDSRTFNAFEAIPELEIPIYFFGGAHDYTVNYSLQRDYYQHIKAPMKAFYTFSNSAHSPLFEEPERALNILVNDVLAGGKALAD